jgi:hypothetical protein
MGSVSMLASPRRRRRLVWLAGFLCVLAVVLAVVALVPSHSGPARGVQAAPRAPAFGETTPTFDQPESPAAARARRTAEAAVRPLAASFVDDLLRRRNLGRAYALLGQDLRSGYSLHDWQEGRLIPISASGANEGSVVAFSGATTVGIVTSVGTNGLVATRFDKTNGRWLVDYIHQGHGSSYVNNANYSPAGFSPGTHTETLWTWLALVGGFLAVVAVAALFESWLRDSRT